MPLLHTAHLIMFCFPKTCSLKYNEYSCKLCPGKDVLRLCTPYRVYLVQIFVTIVTNNTFFAQIYFQIIQGTSMKNNVSTFVTDGKSLSILCEMGLSGMCPKIKELKLVINEAVNIDTVFKASADFQHLTHLALIGSSDFWASLDQSAAFCKNLITAYPRLTGLSFTEIGLGNKTVIEIIGYLRHHKCLASLQ